MKKNIKIAIASALLLPVVGFANTTQTVFEKDSKLPEYMKEQVLKTVLAKCSTGVSENGLSEMETIVTPVQSSDSYYSGIVYETHLASHYYYDYHPRYQEIIVKSFFGRTEKQEGIFTVEIVKAVCPTL